MTASRVFLYFCLCFIGGIFLSSFLEIDQAALLGFLIFGIFLISVFWPFDKLRTSAGRKKITIIGFCLLFLVAGVWRHQQAESRIIYPEEKDITFIGTVVAEPDVRADNIKLTVKASENPEGEPAAPYGAGSSQAIAGKVLVTVDRYPEYQYGDKLKITGHLQKPHIFEDFNYQEYLSKDGIYSVMYRPEVEPREREQYTGANRVVYAKILQFKDGLRKSIYQNLSPPQSTILGAMILGDKRKMSTELKEKLNMAGVRHITAISGMHITILSIILMQILIGLGFRRGRAFYLTVALLVLFIVMVGLPPSAIRAGIMGGLFLLARHLGRQNLSSRALVFAATVMLVINPLLLRLDVGFQLSFLAVMGIIYLGPFLREWFGFHPSPKGILEEWPEGIKKFITRLYGAPYYFFSKVLRGNRTVISIAVMTLGAQIFTLPILIYNFGYVSAVAPVTNVLIVPLLPLVILSGFIFGLAGMILPLLGWILSWFAWLPLTYVITIIDFFSQIPPAYFAISRVWLIILYLTLGILAWRLQEKRKLKSFDYIGI